MKAKYRPRPSTDVPSEERHSLIPSERADSRLFPGWGPRI